ncbi:sensor histidine kinase [Halarcobacter bivalviorum]|uniref:histidine kinase n=1 Tax=Halarcobacter bivalviorum TaxID=663364 RepID=A0AAX2A8V5_9BACT|nr:sensor histidine kinase [Halarcobacter bivalviorum]AXH13121.1 7TMR-DISM-7TM domain-containing two-component system sensor histidine kinase [Halarcobacter bivalviorum]RXK10265.1 histidine kinase [Halarcobacter bivalviorum]
MRKIVFIFFIFYSFSFASDKFGIIDKVYISEDFKTYKLAKYKDYKNKKVEQFSIKVELNKNKISKKTYYLSVVSDYDNLLSSNIKYIKTPYQMLIKLDEKTPDNLLFFYKYENPKRVGFRLKAISEFEYKYLLPIEGIIYGLAYGIIFCAALYYFIIYLSMKKRCFLFYSTMQLFVLLSLFGFMIVSFKPYPSVFAQTVIDIFENLSFIFTILFAKEILNIKKIYPSALFIIKLFLFINFIDIGIILVLNYSLLYEYMPFYISFLIPTLLGVISILKGDKKAIVYTFGWAFMLSFIFMAEKNLISISGIYTIHFVAPMESLIFSFALAFTLKSFVQEKNEKEKLLIHKNKLASMGEMINNIAHQWRQPLMHLSFINMNLQMASYDKKLSKEYLAEKIEESNKQLEFMSNTIDSFRDFYKPQKEKENFFISKAVKQAVEIMSVLLNKENIEIEVEVKKDKEICAYANEYSQVVLNLITNAKDVLVQRKIAKPKIKITIDSYSNKSFTTVCDNAEGINKVHIEKIFEPYFTTKESGSGIGLYMSKTIISSHFKGELKVENKKEGACFTIEV